jgi:hypothetical protein
MQMGLLRLLLIAAVGLVWGCCNDNAKKKTADTLVDGTVPPEPPTIPEEDGPYADLYNALGTTDSLPIRGRLVEEKAGLDPAKTDPKGQMSQDEITETAIDLSLLSAGQTVDIGSVTTDNEGYVDTAIDLSGKGLAAGSYTLQARVADKLVGLVPATLLALDHSGSLVRSDVDLTYLNTQFVSALDKIELLGDEAKDRKALPAMEVVYPAIRGGADGAQNRSLVFLSGSPKFFKRILEGKMALDGVQQDGVVLKPYKDIVVGNLLDFDFGGIIPELEEQVGYKLYWVMRLRLEAPAAAPEILMGDDSEADIVVYVLYHRFTSGELDEAGLMAELEKVDVAKAWSDSIAELAPQVLAHLAGQAPPVEAIYINKTGLDTAHFPVADWNVDGITRYHYGAWPLTLDLYQSGFISKTDVQGVKDRFIALGKSADYLKTRSDHGVSEGYLKAETVAEFE